MAPNEEDEKFLATFVDFGLGLVLTLGAGRRKESECWWLLLVSLLKPAAPVKELLFGTSLRFRTEPSEVNLPCTYHHQPCHALAVLAHVRVCALI